MEERRNRLEFKDFYNKETGEKIRCIRGYEIIKAYFENPEISLFGRKVKKYQHPIAELGSCFAIDYTGVVHRKDYVVVNDREDIEILGVEDFEKLYSKNKMNKTKFLKIESENETFFLKFDSIKFVAFNKGEKETVTIIHTEGREVLTRNNVSNFDEMKEILKNYIEE